MHRISAQTRVSDVYRTPKRKRDDEDEREDQRRAIYPDSSANDSRAPRVEWVLTFGQPLALSITSRNYTSSVGMDGMQVGTVRETVAFDGVAATFRGTEMTEMEICFTLPSGHLNVKWYGNRIYIDDASIIDKEGLSISHRPIQRTPPMHTIYAQVSGENSEPMTVSHARRSYIIRFEAGHPAIVLPRCSYYPLKLVMMKEFLDKFVPKGLYGHPSKTAEQLAEDTRVPPPTPHTPSTTSRANSSADWLTPPSKYVRYERHRVFQRYLPDENSDETSDE